MALGYGLTSSFGNVPENEWFEESVTDRVIFSSRWRAGGGGAASRMWVYAIDEFSELEVDAPDPENQRTLDAFFCLGWLATRDNFGWQNTFNWSTDPDVDTEPEAIPGAGDVVR